MRNLILFFLFSGAVFLIGSGCDSLTNKMIDKSVNEEAHVTDYKSVQDTTLRTHKASCRCGGLTATYTGPIPERRTLCHCNSCQMRTGTAFSIQGRFPRDKVKIEGESTKWTFPNDKGPEVTYRSCDSGGATFHFCPTCGTTVYWDIAAAPDVIGIAIGTLTDPTFPAPVISGFETYGHPWAMNAADLEIIRLEYDELKEKIKELEQKKNKQ
jgi:hypothetical protein